MPAEALGEGGKIPPPRHLASSAIPALLSWNNVITRRLMSVVSLERMLDVCVCGVTLRTSPWYKASHTTVRSHNHISTRHYNHCRCSNRLKTNVKQGSLFLPAMLSSDAYCLRMKGEVMLFLTLFIFLAKSNQRLGPNSCHTSSPENWLSPL